MHLNVPPLIPYAVGLLLVIFGGLRVQYLGAPRTLRMTEADSESSENPPVVRSKEQIRHRRMGVVWVLLGLFLLISTYLQAHRQ